MSSVYYKGKVCRVCKLEKPFEDFPKKGQHRLTTCEVCYKIEQARLWRERYASDLEFKRYQIEKSRRHRWKSEYGLTPDEIYTALAEQDSRCANETCKVKLTLDPLDSISEKANIDHCHSTGKFRSLLCSSCNTLLGRLEKNPKQLSGLIDYLDKHNKETNI